MRTIPLLLLVALTALAESHRGQHIGRAKRELLVRSKRRWVLSTIEIDEEDSGPFPKELSKMYNDQTHFSGEKYKISGMGVDKEPFGVFSINEDTGVVYAHKSVDREEHEIYHIRFDILSKQKGEIIDKELSFNVEVNDINDNAPMFEPNLQADVEENIAEGSPLLPLNVTDRDKKKTPNSAFTISMVSQNPQEPKIELVELSPSIAQLSFKGCFNYDKVKKYEVIVQARDHGTPPLSSTATVTLNIIDRNTHLPTFKKEEYKGEVKEGITKDNVLRIAVDDKDTPKTPGWRAKYFFVKGNEGGNYKLETDPITNEGILSVIKDKDFEKITYTDLVVRVENEEALFVCGTDTPPTPNTVKIKMKVIDINDPPHYEKNVYKLYRIEEEEPGKVLLTPKVYDADSNVTLIRHVLLEESAGWVKIDEKTGKLTTIKKMDRESPFVNDDSAYKIVIGAIDDGDPSETGTSTVLVYLRDINDNKPRLLNKDMILCGNKDNKVMVPATDADINPFSGPFTFSLGGDDKAVTERWKLDPTFGQEAGLVSLGTLPFDKYSVPLIIKDQQSSIGLHTVEVMVCECGEGDVCLGKKPPSSSLGPAGIGLLFLGLLLLLLLLLIFKCQCGGKDFQKIATVQDEGNQTLIKYNQEGGGSASMSEPVLLLTPTNRPSVTDGLKMGTMQETKMAPVMTQDRYTYNSPALGMMNSNMNSQGMQHQRDTVRSHSQKQDIYATWASNKMNTHQGGSSRCNHSVSLRSTQHISDHIEKRMQQIDGTDVGRPEYQPYAYAYEGQGSRCESLDKLSLSNLGDDLMFLNDLGPKFKTLGGICHRTVQKK
ncbi:cadherin-like protein 26 [Anarrhichthys ocellatus]|uniref:cadherin-like protein 26 n=1 Tax=Anarrhichthys ocellatus TaxID=433405 RepID=UPI0012ED6E1C|nr:cadherin-like protein 26 [Anarrhichthys ocellatus]